MTNKANIDYHLIYPSIGTNQKKQTVGCFIKMNNPNYIYTHQQRNKLQRMNQITTKHLKQAFNRVKCYKFLRKKNIDYAYLPHALIEGNAEVMTKYLSILQNQKIASYISFNIPMKNKKKPVMELAQCLQKILKKNYSFFVKRLQELQQNNEVRTKAKQYEVRTKAKQQNNEGRTKAKQKKQVERQLIYDSYTTGKKPQRPIKVSYETIYMSCGKKQNHYKRYKYYEDSEETDRLQIIKRSVVKKNEKQSRKKENQRRKSEIKSSHQRKYSKEIQCHYCKDSPNSKVTLGKHISMYKTSQTFFSADT